MSQRMRSLGICLGASTVSLVALTSQSRPDATPAVLPTQVTTGDILVRPHEGAPHGTLRDALDEMDLTGFDRIVVTGRKFRDHVRLSSISEPQAVEWAYRLVKPPHVKCPAIVSAGGETFMVYLLDAAGTISNVVTGNKCASGTGEFFLQQLRRMDVSLKRAAQWAVDEDPYCVSGRCSVFCKSDCTHATNAGVPKARVTAGLCRMMADKIMALLQGVDRRNIMLIGGTAQNKMVCEYLSRDIKNLIVPDAAPYFEALGAALYGLNNPTVPFPGYQQLFRKGQYSFDTLPALKTSRHRVEFKTMAREQVRAGDKCILGLDVGSTTTKAVLIRGDDNALLASIYLRTNGDPVGASRRCYKEIWNQLAATIDPKQIRITGLGICGSGRQIAGLHALTRGVINEIIAHATAALYFDPEVDTLFEIGGQDAKYTYITGGVASDYAMNEACSAGTGSFLEESALETLGIPMENIADIAMEGRAPPNFNDQCAAFIASDIKNAIHQGVGQGDIVAGLVYSICVNYANRVKGHRPVGRKVFMQGGVCYNRAVPMAMAALVDKKIIVPPEPGLMGAFGVALEIKKRINSRLMKEETFDLDRLSQREVRYRQPFTCKGGKERCDRRCEIARIELEDNVYAFGGACNRYDNIRRRRNFDVESLDLVRKRHRLIFETHTTPMLQHARSSGGRTVGINRSFLTNTYLPLYATFFEHLGIEPLLPDVVSPEGIDRPTAPFCYPAQLSHGFFKTLLDNPKVPEFLFLPHFKSVPAFNGSQSSQLCPLVQSEGYYLKAAFRQELDALEKQGTRVLSPVLDLTPGLQAARPPLISAAQQMGIQRRRAHRAFATALKRQKQCLDDMRATGRLALDKLAEDPHAIAVVLVARPYNGYVDEAHMGIPAKFASRGIMVIPVDFLHLAHQDAPAHMYWGMGQRILAAARLIKDHPQLFGVYSTNFSCGPDSFLINYFRSIMGRKPSLTLELDSHTADAGLETRIEAFLDIVAAFRKLQARRSLTIRSNGFKPARVVLHKDTCRIITSHNERLELTDPRITLLIPSMGDLGSSMLAAVFRSYGVNAKAHPPADESVLKLGRGSTSCKECLPLILTTGTLLKYLKNGRRPDEVVIYFMATGSGPCRFGQYAVFMESLIREQAITDVALLSLTSENAYRGIGRRVEQKAWWAVVVSDVMEDIRSMLLVNAVEPDEAMAQFNASVKALISALESGDFSALEQRLRESSHHLAGIPLKRPPESVPTISLTGEIFVRRDGLSRQYIVEWLAKRGLAVTCAPVAEWIKYCDYLLEHGLTECKIGPGARLKHRIRKSIMARDEKRIKTILAASGLVHLEPLLVEPLIRNAKPHISRHLTGEAVLTVGGALTEIATTACGVIAIGPFGCMPNRISEAILSRVMNTHGKSATDPRNPILQTRLAGVTDLPFLAIESDGSPFPQVVQAKLEAFCLSAKRLHRRMQP